MPYTMQAAFSVERQLTKNCDPVGHLPEFPRRHQLLLRNANAPLPGTYNPDDPTSGIRPFGGTTNIYQYNFFGDVFEQNQLIANLRVELGKLVVAVRLLLPQLCQQRPGRRSAVAVAEAAFSVAAPVRLPFVMNSYDPEQDWGRAAFDVRNRFFLGGTISLPHAFRLSPSSSPTPARPSTSSSDRT